MPGFKNSFPKYICRNYRYMCEETVMQEWIRNMCRLYTNL